MNKIEIPLGYVPVPTQTPSVEAKPFVRSERRNKIYGQVVMLSEKLNVRGEMKSAYLNHLSDLISGYSDNEIFIFFNEAPNQFDTMPKPAEVKEYFNKNILPTTRKEVKQIDTAKGCPACKQLGFVTLYNTDGNCGVHHCSCSLGNKWRVENNIPSKETLNNAGYFKSNWK